LSSFPSSERWFDFGSKNANRRAPICLLRSIAPGFDNAYWVADRLGVEMPAWDLLIQVERQIADLVAGGATRHCHCLRPKRSFAVASRLARFGRKENGSFGATGEQKRTYKSCSQPRTKTKGQTEPLR
jgi:hypothetical protein